MQMKKLILFLTIALNLFFSPKMIAQDTVSVHTVRLSNVGNVFKVEDKIVTADIYQKYEAEQKNFMQKCTGEKPCWINFMRGNQIVEEGIFCKMTAVGTHFKYDEKGKVTYKKIYSKPAKNLSCSKLDYAGSEATEEIFDKSGCKIFGTYKDGFKEGRWLYYDNANNIIGYEDFEKGISQRKKGKVFTTKVDGSFDIVLAKN
jgi:antitoxin component YwqK of YwqJK toxin-antitoxin module